MMPNIQQQMHMQAVNQQQVPNQSQPPPQAQQLPSQAQQASQTPHLQPNQQFISAHAQPDQNQRNVIKQRESSLFNSYVYDFLKRSGAHETARTYLREGENLKIKNDGANSISGGGNSSSDNNVGGPLPDADVPVQAPEGFLYEWWTVFWDIYSVKLNRQGSMEAQRYVTERRGNRVMGQLPTMSAYQNPQIVQAAQAAQVAQAAAAVQQQQQQMRIMQQMPQHQPQQAQQTSQQPVQQQPQQAPSQPSQPPQQPQQTPQQPQPQPSPANHQPQQFNNNRQQMPNGVIDTNNTNGDILTSPQRTNTLKIPPQRRAMMQQLQQARNPAAMLAIQQQQQQHPHQGLQNNVQTQAVQSQAQNSQPIQSQQNTVVNQGQIQQQTASHMTPNQAQAQLNQGTKRGVEVQSISQNMSMQATSPKRQKMEQYNNSIAAQRQQQQPTQPGQMAMSTSMMLTTPVSNEISSIASPDLKNRPSHLATIKKNNPQIQQMPRGPQQSMTPMNNKPHVNQQMPIVQNTVAHDSEYMNQIHNQINKQINASNQTMQNISSFIPMHQGVRLPNYVNSMNMSMMMPRKIPQNAMMQHLAAEKQRNINEMGQQMVRPGGIPGLYMLQGHHQQIPNVADVGPNNNSAQQLRKNEVKGAKNGKTTPTQSQSQVPNGNVSNVAAIQQQQPVIPGNNEVQQDLSQLQNMQTQLSAQTSSTVLADGSLEMNMDEVNNYADLSFEDYLNFEQMDEFNDDQLGSSSNAGPSNGN